MSKVRAWLQLFRVPNLLTVPGDPLAGFLLASGGRLDERAIPAVAACLCLYMAGLAMNDLADQKEDAAERPNRPLPSGAVPRAAAIIVTGNLIIFGLGFAAVVGPPVALMALGVLLGVILYDFFTKKIPVVGALNMGVCRGMSVLVGGAAGMGPDPGLLAVGQVIEPISSALAIPFYALSAGGMQRFVYSLGGALLITLFIAAVTNLARHETKASVPKIARLLPLGFLLVDYAVLKSVTLSLFLDAAPTLWVLAIFMVAGVTAQIMREPMPPLPPRIGSLIRILPILQASLCVVPSLGAGVAKTSASLICALALLAMVPLHAWLARKFYAS